MLPSVGHPLIAGGKAGVDIERKLPEWCARSDIELNDLHGVVDGVGSGIVTLPLLHDGEQVENQLSV
jgi:hypothetical protein